MKDLKKEDKYFIDWESHVFGYGYGTGENNMPRKFVEYEKYYTLKHKKTIRKFENRIKAFVREHLEQEFVDVESTIQLSWQNQNIRPIQISIFMRDVSTVSFEYKARLQLDLNKEFGRITGERFCLVDIFTKGSLCNKNCF